LILAPVYHLVDCVAVLVIGAIEYIVFASNSSVDGTLKQKVAYVYDERENEVGLTVFNAAGSVKNGETQLINIEYD
jgi:hypothetical protein